ncbi:6-phosphogluconate dehydrogenase (decarboxylating) [Apiospora marii]|uniref:6-phosphogluconate dehydrogenase, decarboxylating n=1 Tax=Apiospora marii TaxID=335849 RepID=A0ABR1R877_9PEZI
MAGNNSGLDVKKLGMFGVGSMGAMMSLLYAEKGAEVHFFDPSQANMDALAKQAKNIKLDRMVVPEKSYEAVCKAIETKGEPKVFVFSTPHGEPADKCVEGLKPFLKKGDIIVDCGNEHWTNTERRQRDLEPKGIHYIGCGVSGGYQAARAGPSMSPGGKPEALKQMMPFFQKVAAKDSKGRPCVTPVGPRGSGHYVKMVHNGIEQGMMSVLAEAWLMMSRGLGLRNDEIRDVFKAWDASGPLSGCFLVAIGVDVESAKGKDGKYVLDSVRDKVVQDVDEEEGTGTWTCEQAVMLHVPCSSILAAHLFRCASADLGRRKKNKKSAGGGIEPKPLSVASKQKFLEQLHMATYFCFLTCFAQGLDLIRAKDKKEKWGLDYRNVLQLWRGGCIIRAEHITDIVLERAYARPDHDVDDVLGNPEVARELTQNYPALKSVVLQALEADGFVPSMSQCLEYYKYETSTALPTQFMEAQLDYFGQHMFDRQDDPVGGPTKGQHHHEWKPATGSSDNRK